MYCSWDMKQDGQNFLSFWTVFCYFTSINPKNQNFEKLKKGPEDIIILHMHAAINENQMYCSWNVEHDRQIVLSFWTIFCSFTPLPKYNNQKYKNFEKIKKTTQDIIILHMCTKKYNYMWCVVPEKSTAMNRIFCHFDNFLDSFLQ